MTENVPNKSQPNERGPSESVPTAHSVASTDGVVLAVHHFGGEGPPLLISHATGFHGRAYAPFIEHLVEHYDVWTVDLRGHGATPAPASGDFAWAGMAADVEHAIRYVLGHGSLDALYAIGHSMGAASVLRVGCESPELIRAAYVFEPISFPDRTMIVQRDSVMSRAARARRADFPSREAVRERYGSRPPLSDLTPAALAAYVEHGFADTDEGVTLCCRPESEARTFEAADKMIYADMAVCSVPVMVGAGAPTEGFSPANMAPGVAEAIPGAILRIHADLGHFGPLQDPAKIASEVHQFFVEATRTSN